MMKKLKILVSAGFALGILLGCVNTKSNNSNRPLEFWTMQLSPKFNQYFFELNRKFETQNQDVLIRWIDIPWSAMESKILTAISANTAPDLVNLNPNFASQLASRDAWLDIDEVITPEVKDIYLPNIWQASSIEICQRNSCEQDTFGIPWYLTTRITIYNQQLLKASGVTKPPETYEKLKQTAQQIKNKTGKYAFFTTFVPGDSGEVLESMVQMGVQLIDEKGKAAFDTPEGIAAFRYWVDLYQQKLLPPEALTQGHRYGVELYQAGETAMLFSGAEFLSAIGNNAPTIATVSAAAPQITGKTGKKNVAVMNLAIPRKTAKPDEALQYALYITNTENQLEFAQKANVLPSTREAVQQYIENLEQETNSTPLQQARKVSALQLKDAQVLIPAMDNLQLLQKTIYENLQAAMLEEKTVEEAVKDAASEWNKTKR